jgi:ubiquinone/menaquinone biosynthesis C-methylase UbiE
MAVKRVDYDQIAPCYDRRFKNGTSKRAATAQTLLGLAERVQARRILEVGCGTGRWLADLWATGGQLIGLDLSAGMLRQARRKDASLDLVRGRAGQCAFAGQAFDLVYCVNAIHHFDRQRAFVAEARRLLRLGGLLAVIGMDPHDRRDDWYVYRYFPGTYETDLARHPTWEAVIGWMAAEGFKRIERQPVEQIVDAKVGDQVLSDPFLRKHACSQLALLSDEAYARGLGRIRTALAEAKTSGATLTFPVNLTIEALTGRVPA